MPASIATARDTTDTGVRQHPAWPDPVPLRPYAAPTEPRLHRFSLKRDHRAFTAEQPQDCPEVRGHLRRWAPLLGHRNQLATSAFAGWRPAGPASPQSGAHSRARHDHAKKTQGHKQHHATAGRCRLNAHCAARPDAGVSSPRVVAAAFSDRTISGIARAACGLAPAARRTERHVNADRHMRASSRLDPARRAVSTHHARASSARMPRRRDGRLPCSKRAVSILQLWCNLNPCTSIRGLH